jgi:hypothetical protein
VISGTFCSVAHARTRSTASARHGPQLGQAIRRRCAVKERITDRHHDRVRVHHDTRQVETRQAARRIHHHVVDAHRRANEGLRIDVPANDARLLSACLAMPQPGPRRLLAVDVAQRHRRTHVREHGGKVRRQRALATAALPIDYRDDGHVGSM